MASPKESGLFSTESVITNDQRKISGILLEHHVINKPLSFVVRKGKRHYVCDSRLKIYDILADLIGQKQGRKPLFPGYGAMVFDESHKLIDAARQMYSTVWGEQDAEFIVGLSEVNRRTTGMDELTVLRSQLAEYNRQIFDRLAGDLAGNHTKQLP